MDELNMKINALIRYVTAGTEQERRDALQALQDLPMGTAKPSRTASNLDNAIQDLLLELGVPGNLSGHRVLSYAIRAVIDVPDLINNITKGLYPTIAAQINTTPHRAERQMRHAIEVCWDRIDIDVCANLFGSTVSPVKGKPTNSEFVARCAQIVRRRMAGQ